MSPEADIAARKPVGVEPGLSLVEQAEGLGRAAVMKDVAGPVIDEIMRPMYESNFDDQEIAALGKANLTSLERLKIFGFDVESILETRFRNLESSRYKEIDNLNNKRDELFYHHEVLFSMFREGIKSGIAVPLTLASHIYKIEKGAPKAYGEVGDEVLDIDYLSEIMEREEFDEILLHLTKGPNGFLGVSSTQLSAESTGFFDFPSLRMDDAYEVVDGRVTGLSETYHIRAHQRRQDIRQRHRASNEDGYIGAIDSSGCPMRHSFEDPETGEPQEPLVITAKKFLITALKATEETS